ncbi:MAG: hypothetical protein CL916_08330 [Deltaproteobacteria bacterium]|nr:hypothetical protein [Deltaproteobacteria bacterium]
MFIKSKLRTIRFSEKFLILTAVCFGLSTSSCSSLNRIQKQSGMKTKTIKLKDLGPKYLAHKDSDFDYFNNDAKQKLVIKYRRFRLNKFDRFNKKATILFAKFKIAQRIIRDFDSQINSLLKNGLKGETRKSLRNALRKRSSKKLKTVRKLGHSYEALSLSLRSLKSIVVDAKELVDISRGLTAQTKKEAMTKPDKAVLLDKVASESKRTLKRLFSVIKESPGLIKSMISHLKISKVASVVKKPK